MTSESCELRVSPSEFEEIRDMLYRARGGLPSFLSREELAALGYREDSLLFEREMAAKFGERQPAIAEAVRTETKPLVRIVVEASPPLRNTVLLGAGERR